MRSKTKKKASPYYYLFFIYSCFWKLLFPLLRFFSLLFPSIRRQINHRTIKEEELRFIADQRSHYEKAFIFYCSSAGEYEQAIPIISKLSSDSYIHVFFHSVSGYHHAQSVNEKLPYHLTPIDTVWSWQRIFDAIKPNYSFIVRHEFWPSFIFIASQHSSLCAVNVAIKNKPSFFSKLIRVYLFQFFDQLFFVSDKDVELIYEKKPNNAIVTGNTKFERALQRKSSAMNTCKLIKNKLDQYSSNKRFIVGSAWKKEVELVINAYLLLEAEVQKEWTLIIVPHQIDEETIKYIRKYVTERDLTVQYFDTLVNRSNVIVVRELGILAELYGCSNISLIGGGFDEGTHNVVEAAVYEIPMLSGPITHTDREAFNFEKVGGLITVKNAKELLQWWSNHEAHDRHIKKLTKQLFNENINASNKILQTVLH